MSTPSDHITVEELERGIDGEGIVEDSYRGVETRYARIEAVGTVMDGDDPRYLVVIADYRDHFLETRIPLGMLRKVGWTWRRADAEPDEEVR